MRWRVRQAALVLAALVLAVSLGWAGAGARAEPDIATLGAAIFGGTAERLDNAAAAQGVARLPCKSCHGADGLGCEEGRVPPIDGPALSRATAERPAYDRAAFAAALRDGTAAGAF